MEVSEWQGSNGGVGMVVGSDVEKRENLRLSGNSGFCFLTYSVTLFGEMWNKKNLFCLGRARIHLSLA